MKRAPVQGPIQRATNPSEDNPRRRRRRRRRNPGKAKNPRNPKVSYGHAALIGASLGAIGVAIAAASRSPVPVVATDAGTFAVSTDSTAMRAIKGAVRGAAIGMAVGVSAAVIAKNTSLGKPLGRMMNPSGPGSALILGSTVGATTLALDAGIHKAMTA